MKLIVSEQESKISELLEFINIQRQESDLKDMARLKRKSYRKKEPKDLITKTEFHLALFYAGKMRDVFLHKNKTKAFNASICRIDFFFYGLRQGSENYFSSPALVFREINPLYPHSRREKVLIKLTNLPLFVRNNGTGEYS